MTAEISGVALLYYLFEVSEAIDLLELQRLLGSESSKAQLAFKHTAPSYLRFQNPPLVFASDYVHRHGQYSFQTKIKYYDYGVMSVTLQTSFTGSWEEFVDLGASVLD